MSYPRVATLRTPADLRAHLDRIGATLPLDDTLLHGSASPLAQSWRIGQWSAGNRIAVLPMEGWDGTADGHPSDLTIRRWQRFGLSGAKLIWGGEAVAVRHDGRANARQLVAREDTLADLAGLRETLIRAHEEHFSTSTGLLIGLQLTHSGRFCKPNDDKRIEPQILYHHPWLDRKYKLAPDQPLLSDDDIARLIEDFGRAARIAQRAGYTFVDLKHCHGYLGHEFLTAVDRPGRYGGSFENRTRFLREASAAIRAAAPGIGILAVAQRHDRHRDGRVGQRLGPLGRGDDDRRGGRVFGNRGGAGRARRCTARARCGRPLDAPGRGSDSPGDQAGPGEQPRQRRFDRRRPCYSRGSNPRQGPFGADRDTFLAREFGEGLRQRARGDRDAALARLSRRTPGDKRRRRDAPPAP
jgi:hypothetical protein